MYDLLIYSLKAGVCLAVFYLFFKLLLSRETLHRFNRIVCLAAVALSFLLPLCVITVVRELPALPGAAFEAAPAPAELPATPAPFAWEGLLAAVFAAGAVVTLGRMLWSVGCVLRLVGRGRRERLGEGAVLVRLDEAVMPFSWGRYIVISERDYAESGAEILIHEQAHVRLRHSWDILLTDLAGCLQWFNPAMWLLRRELRAIHEYEADEAVLRSGVDPKHYQLMLIKKAVGGRWYSVANSFNHSKLKNRITMMLQKKSSRWACAKALFLLPLVGIALSSFARTAYVVPDDKVKKESVTVQIADGNTTVDGVEGDPIVFVDGKQASKDALETDRIATVRVLKGDAATAQYGPEGKDGVIEVTLKKEGDGSRTELDDRTQEGIVFGSKSGNEAQVSETTVTVGPATTGRVIRIRGIDPEASDSNPVFIVDGAVVSKERIEQLGPGDIADMSVDKTGKDDGVILITTKRNKEAIKAAGTAVREGYAAAREGIKAGEEGIEAARDALNKARKHMSKKEWKEQLRQLDQAQKQLAEAREKMAALDAEMANRPIETRNGSQVRVRVDKNSSEPSVAVDISKSGAASESSTVTISGGKISTDLAPSLMDEKVIVYIDGRKADRAELKHIASNEIRLMNVYKGAAAVAKYGEEARNGVIEVTTKSK